jgi:hypothetical protein
MGCAVSSLVLIFIAFDPLPVFLLCNAGLNIKERFPAHVPSPHRRLRRVVKMVLYTLYI